VFKQILYVSLLSIVLGLGVNLVAPDAIPYIGNYRDLSSGDGPIVPPEAQAGDPPFIAVDLAELEYSTGQAIFIDTRDSEEYECGTIPGSICIPFEYLPEHDLDQYLDSALAKAPRDTLFILFCSGEECDLSLHLARNMQDIGYTNMAIFFGGSREWEKHGLEIERRRECAN